MDLSDQRQELKRSMILPVAARYMMPLLLTFSIFLLIRGHNEVGGGFVGGLVASAGLVLYGIANSFRSLHHILPAEPRVIAAIGLFLAGLSGIISWQQDLPFFTGLWFKQTVPVIGKLGTPLLFDFGVYLLVIGIVLWILLSFAEE